MKHVLSQRIKRLEEEKCILKQQAEVANGLLDQQKANLDDEYLSPLWELSLRVP